MSYDTDTRTFKGTIRYGTATNRGYKEESYEMIFSEDFETISDGWYRVFNRTGQEDKKERFGKDRYHCRSIGNAILSTISEHIDSAAHVLGCSACAHVSTSACMYSSGCL